MKYCILAAGIGSRNKAILGLHKGLLPIQNIPTISHTINKFDNEKEIIITVGHKSEQIKSYLKFVHPNRKIKFIEIDRYTGKGSGPGYSLLQCKEELQCPFVFGTIDTFFEEDIIFDVKNNWIGVSKISEKDSKKFCLVKGKEKFESIYYGTGNLAYNGFAGIYDYTDFWTELEKPNLINNEHQVTTAFKGLQNIELRYFKNLHDTGTEEEYLKIRKQFGKEVVFAKNDEAIFIDNKRVVKYFSDENKCKNRIKRTHFLKKFLPNVQELNSNMYGYDFINATLLSDISDTQVFSNLLEKYYKFSLIDKASIDLEKFHDNCVKMYKSKTYDRVKKLQDTDIDKINYINGTFVQPAVKIFDKIDWEHIVTTAIPANFHGDFQPENILIAKEDKMFLIDWRESFGNDLEIGDFYYDLAKLYHGLIINGTIAKEKKYSLNIKQNIADISYQSKNNLLDFNKILESFCKNHRLDYEKVKLLGVLQYVNIAIFYQDTEPEYSKFIFLLGKLLMTEILGLDGADK